MKRTVVPILLVLLLFGFSPAQDAVKEKPAQTRPLSVGIVVDNSGSYRTIFDRIINSTNKIIDAVQPGDEAFFVTFVNASKIVLRQEMTRNVGELRDASDGMFIEGGATAVLDAVVYASKYMAEQAASSDDRSRVLVLITDGDDRESAASIDEAVKAAKDAKVRVYVLGLHEEKFYTKAVDRLVRETGGAKFVPKFPKDTETAVSGLLTALRAK